MSGLSAEEQVVIGDLESRGWRVGLSRGTGRPTGEPDLKAERSQDTIYLEVKKLQSRPDGNYGVTITQAQLPRHSVIARGGSPCYLAFVSGMEVFYYRRTEAP